MAKSNFKKALAVTAKWEGGWSDHPDDPGGKTYKGVTQKNYNYWRKKWGKSTQSVRNLTEGEWARIYHDGYWANEINCEGLFPGVDLATFDAKVNSGPSRGNKWLLASLDKNDNHVQTVKNICKRRLSFMQSLRIWKTFGKGWSRRVADIKAKGILWAAEAMELNPKKVIKEEADNSKKDAAKNVGGGAAGVGGGAGVENMTDFSSIFIWVLVAAIVGFALYRFVINKQQQKALENELENL